MKFAAIRSDALGMAMSGQARPGDLAEAWKEFGKRLSLRRGRRSRREIAELAGISMSTLQQLEQGGRTYRGEWILPSPEPKTLQAVRIGLGVPPEAFSAELEKWGVIDADDLHELDRLDATLFQQEVERQEAAQGQVDHQALDDHMWVVSISSRLMGLEPQIRVPIIEDFERAVNAAGAPPDALFYSARRGDRASDYAIAASDSDTEPPMIDDDEGDSPRPRPSN